MAQLQSTQITGSLSTTGTVTAQTFVGDGSGLQNVAGVTSEDRINFNKQTLKNEYLQEGLNHIANGGSIILNDTYVDYSSSYNGIVTDIFKNETNVTSGSNIAVNAQSPADGFGNVQIVQNLLPYGTEAVFVKENSDLFQFFFYGSPSVPYNENDYRVFAYMYSPDGSNAWLFLKSNSPSSYVISAVVNVSLGTNYDISTYNQSQYISIIEHEADMDPAFGQSDTDFDGSIFYDRELNVVRLLTKNENFSTYRHIFVEYQVTGQEITGYNIIQDNLELFFGGIFNGDKSGNGIYNSDGTKFVWAEFSQGFSTPTQLYVESFNVSPAFSQNYNDYGSTGSEIFTLSSNFTAFSELNPMVRISQDGSNVQVVFIADNDQAGAIPAILSTKISLSSFVVDSNSSILEENLLNMESNKDINNKSIFAYDGVNLTGASQTYRDMSSFSTDYYEYTLAGLGDIQSPASFERSIDLTNDLDSPPTSVILTQQDNSDDGNVTISVDISDGTNTVTITQLDTEVDCSALTSRTLTATWNLSVSDVQGTNAKIENYALNFR